jgi:hypothetical protein
MRISLIATAGVIKKQASSIKKIHFQWTIFSNFIMQPPPTIAKP